MKLSDPDVFLELDIFSCRWKLPDNSPVAAGTRFCGFYQGVRPDLTWVFDNLISRISSTVYQAMRSRVQIGSDRLNFAHFEKWETFFLQNAAFSVSA
jgi:hypothetical protein